MTWGTEQKRHLLNRFKGCYQHTYPKGVSVHIRDHMQDLKYKVTCAGVTTGHPDSPLRGRVPTSARSRNTCIPTF